MHAAAAAWLALGGAAAAAPQSGTSSMECYGTVIQNRACLFRDVVYDRAAQTFLFYYDERSVSVVPSPHLDNDKFLQLGLEAAANNPTVPLRLSFLDAPLPPLEEMCVEETPSMLHKTLGEFSYGHILVDNLYPIVYNLAHFGALQRNHQLLTYVEPTPLFRHYGIYVATSVRSWRSQLEACSSRLVLYRELIAGQGAVVMFRPNTTYPRVQHDPPAIAELRRRALRLGGVRDATVAEVAVRRVVFNAKAKDDRRRILNLEVVADALRQRFPTIAVEVHQFPAMHAYEQLRILASTSVFVTNIGSASFRLVYLPPGAHVVLVGPPKPRDVAQGLGEFPFTEPHASGFTEVLHWKAFKVPVTFHLYNVTERTEYVVPRVDRYGKTGDARDLHFTYWDSDLVVNATKLGDMVAHALTALQSASRG